MISPSVFANRRESQITDIAQSFLGQPLISEYLTKVNVDVSSPLRSLDLSTEAGTAFVNVAFWKSEQDFLDHFKPQDGYFDPETEVAPRTRIALEIKGAAGNLPEGFSIG